MHQRPSYWVDSRLRAYVRLESFFCNFVPHCQLVSLFGQIKGSMIKQMRGYSRTKFFFHRVDRSAQPLTLVGFNFAFHFSTNRNRFVEESGGNAGNGSSIASVLAAEERGNPSKRNHWPHASNASAAAIVNGSTHIRAR
jgi:hypothetical protein